MQKKHYQTAARSALLAYLATNSEHPQSAEEIRRGLTAQGHAVGQSTVYRLLADLCAGGAVKKYHAGKEGEGFVYAFVGAHRHCEHHLHLQCVRCGAVRHLECDYNTHLSEHLRTEHGFLVDCGRSVLLGLCAACTEAKA